MENRWQEIWNKRKLDDSKIKIWGGDTRETFLELKRCDGFDVLEGGVPYESFLQQYHDMLDHLRISAPASAFEVGCGAGANLYLLWKDGFTVGGMDYSEALIKILQRVFPSGVMKECITDEASNLPTEQKYDVVFSNSVFSYFPDVSYATAVLEKMLAKATKAIALLDVHDAAKKEAFLSYRRANVEDYEERYKDLPKLFYPRDFFEAFAQQHDLTIEFTPSTIPGYWNNDFIYHCYLHRK